MGLVQVCPVPLLFCLDEWNALLLRHLAYELLNVKWRVKEVLYESVRSHVSGLWLFQRDCLSQKLHEPPIVVHHLPHSENCVGTLRLVPLVQEF